MVAYACGWYPDESDFLSFMRPELYDKPKTDHLAFDPSSQFYWRSYENAQAYEANPSSQVSNLFGWMEQVGNGVAVEDVSTVVYSLPFETLNDCYTTLQKNKKWAVPDSLKSNGMLAWLMQKKNRDVLGYLVHAKKSEVLSVREYNPWDPAPVDTALAEACLKEARLGFAKSKLPFLKSRYAFQLVKSAFYGNRYQECIANDSIYGKAVRGINTNLDQRMASYCAGALYKLGRTSEAAYRFALMFNETVDIDVAYAHSLGFIWSERETPLNEVLAFCKNDAERSIVYAMYGTRNVEPYRTEFMENCFRYNNKNELLDVLLMREINKAELNYLQMRSQMELGYYVYDGWTGGLNFPLEETMKKERVSFLKNGAPTELKKLNEFVHRMRQEEALKNKPLWTIADGYLAYMCEDYPSARTSFEQAATSSSLREADRNQLLILNLLVDLREKKIALPNFENELENKLTQLETLVKSGKEGESYQQVFQNVLKSELPAYFMRKQDSLREMLSYQRFENSYESYEEPSSEKRLMHFSDCYGSHSGSLLDRYFSQRQLTGLIDFQRSASSPLDRWLLQGNRYDERIVRELQGVKYFRNFEYEKALDILKGQDNLPVVPDIFYMYVNDYQDVGENNMEQTYTTKEVLEQLIDLKKKAPADAFMAYRYASVLYSLSYHGRCHEAWNFYRDATEIAPYYFNSTAGHYTPFELQYYYADEAYTCFRKAYDKSTDPIIKQNALWMMAKCEQKRCPSLYEKQPYWNTDDALDYVNWCVNQNAWLARFHNQYKGSAFYQKVYEECAYLQLFAAKQ